jgi:enoyl-CoA hydratase/carnithine racemase
VPPDRLLPRAVEIAEMIAANAPLSVEATKAALRLWRMQGSVEAQTLHEWARRTIVGSEDYREGPIAFAEKRRPVWKGR